jgi:hypothetical protein
MLVRAYWGQDESLPELLKAIRGGGAGLWLQYLLQNIKPGLWHQPSSVPVLEGLHRLFEHRVSIHAVCSKCSALRETTPILFPRQMSHMATISIHTWMKWRTERLLCCSWTRTLRWFEDWMSMFQIRRVVEMWLLLWLLWR